MRAVTPQPSWCMAGVLSVFWLADPLKLSSGAGRPSIKVAELQVGFSCVSLAKCKNRIDALVSIDWNLKTSGW